MKSLYQDITIQGVPFVAYKHWSYEGNPLVYAVSSRGLMIGGFVGEIVDGKFIKRTWREDQMQYLKDRYSKEVLKVIL